MSPFKLEFTSVFGTKTLFLNQLSRYSKVG
jgi:hypothetical protein